LNQLVKSINFENTKVVIIISPGFTEDDFKKYMEQKIDKNIKERADLKSNLNIIIYIHSSSGFKHSFEEILIKPEIKRLIKDTKCIDDVSVMERFNEILGADMYKVLFGHKVFAITFEKKAIVTLIIADGYLRKIPAAVSKDLSSKIKELKTYTLEVCQFSKLHTTEEKID